MHKTQHYRLREMSRCSFSAFFCRVHMNFCQVEGSVSEITSSSNIITPPLCAPIYFVNYQVRCKAPTYRVCSLTELFFELAVQLVAIYYSKSQAMLLNVNGSIAVQSTLFKMSHCCMIGSSQVLCYTCQKYYLKNHF